MPLDPFHLPDDLPAKAAPQLIDADREHLRRIADTLARQRAEVAARLGEVRRHDAKFGDAAVDRDLEIRRLSGRLRVLERFGLDVCLGRMTPAQGPPVYIGRTGLAAADGTRLLVDWRTPAAEPYFAATMEDPRGLVSRRRYRWADGRVSDYWDEALTPAAFDSTASLDDQSAFIAGLGTHRTSRMRDVLATIQADQDAIIRTPSPGALVVDGGPGTGKTVVALHRAAHLLYSEPRLTQGAGGMLLVGPNAHYLAYVEDVLPSLGENAVRLCTLRDLVPEGATAVAESDPRVARVKASLDPATILDAAARSYESPPQHAIRLESPWADLWMSRQEWAELFSGADPSASHNEARDEVWEEILELLSDQVHDEDVPPHVVRRWLRQDDDLTGTFVRAWPLLTPASVVARLWSSPDFLRRCAPALSSADLAVLRREGDEEWTDADLPFLDAARRRIGDPDSVREEHRRQAVIASAQEQISHVVDHLIEDDDSEMKVMSILRGQDARNVLLGVDAPLVLTTDELTGPFGHIVVDEAQELTDAEWRMLIARCPSRSFTIVGDRAQARHGFTESWEVRLAHVGVRDIRVAHLGVNYRTPAEVMEVAAPAILATIPDANVPTSVRESGIPVRSGVAAELPKVLDEWLGAHPEGVACVIGDPEFAPTARVRSLTPEGAKGLEFDLVVLVHPERFGDDVTGAVDRYVSMTRTTRELVVLR
ncbi:RNA polymerase recycling motor ATPase HelR [Microbacterium sp. MYb62]|uniref:RNA polymerase recycling motor ATPase HelR n=1 Tax=Microbacterium sp. MYb62 TaxID=1848690 RepID=UPI000CFC8634|nr:RNA polymerase recycling motor ATPase HelR [Microbacterium sp. MYb62]PRB09336.1 AAA family ATPase [Microbacterium sp. MYb62]